MILIISLVILLPLLILRLYTKLTCGINQCSKHLVGKVVIVTGANSGIGYQSAKDFADRGARVILACRNEQRGTNARDKIIRETGNQDVHFGKLDLASLSSVREFAENIIKNEKRLDVLINNAGVVMGKVNNKELTEDGLLSGMQTNHYGPFLLTCLLLDKMKSTGPSRIINVTSATHLLGNVELDNMNLQKDLSWQVLSTPFQVYANSKLCNILMTVELARRLENTGVTANAVCPGVVETEMIDTYEGWLFSIIMFFLKHFVMKTAWQGAQTMIYLAVSPEVNNISGKYFRDCSQARSSKLSRDTNLARKLWEHSEKSVKL